MPNAAARRSFCGSSTFFAFAVFLLCLSSVVAATGHSIVLQKRNVPYQQLAVREAASGSSSAIVTKSTTASNPISVTTTNLGAGASVTSKSSTPISFPQSSASSSLSPSSKASSSIQTTSKAHSTLTSTTASSSSLSTSIRGDQRPSGSAESFTPSSSAPPASKISSATPSPSVLPSQPSAPASVNTPNPVPATTLLGFNSIPSFTTFSPIETITSATPTSAPVVAAAARSSAFWNNKGVVAAVFVIVSLVAVGALIVAFITLRKRHRARKLHEDHADLWEKFSDNSHRTRSNSPGPSINAAPLDAFAVRDESYIPAEAGSGHQDSASFYSSRPIQHPDYYTNYPPAFSQQTLSSATSSQAAPPTAFREPVGRASYQQSIDSFYGATGRAL